MTKNLWSFCKNAACLTGLAVTFAVGQVSAQDGSRGRLEGVWEVQVTIIDCQTGDVMRTFPSVTVFAAGGGVIDSTSGIPQALKTPGQGIWKHVDGDNYKFKFKTFNFNAQNVLTGWTIIEHEATLNSKADAYTSSGTAEIYLPNGIKIATGCSSTISTRFDF